MTRRVAAGYCSNGRVAVAARQKGAVAGFHAMAHRVSLWSAPGAAHAGSLTFTQGKRHRGYFTCTATLMLDGEEWSIALDMITPYLRDMLGFFEEMAEARSGWKGTKWWESEFDELTIWGRNEGHGLVTLDVLMRWPLQDEHEQGACFAARADELSRVSRELREFTGLPRGSRFQRFGRSDKDRP